MFVCICVCVCVCACVCVCVFVCVCLGLTCRRSTADAKFDASRGERIDADVPLIVAKTRAGSVFMRALPAPFLAWALRRVMSKVNEVRRARICVCVGGGRPQ